MVIYFITGVLILWTSDDCPQGSWINRKLPDKKTPSSEAVKSKDDKQHNPIDGQRNGIVNTAFDSGNPSLPFQWRAMRPSLPTGVRTPSPNKNTKRYIS